MGVSKGAKYIMTSGSGQHYYMAKRGNGTDTYSKSHKSPKVEKLYSHKDEPEEKRRSERPDRMRKSSKVRRSRERDSFRQIPIGYSKTMKNFWEKLLQSGGDIGDSVLNFMPVRTFVADERFDDSDESTCRLISSIDQNESFTHDRGDSLRTISKKKCTLQFWQRRDCYGFTLLISQTISKTRVIQIIRLLCLAMILAIVIRNHGESIFHCFCFTPTLLVVLLLS